MKKKYILITAFIFSFILILIFIAKNTGQRSSKNFFQNTIPLINNKSDKIKVTTTPTIFKGEGIPPQTNYKKAANQITDEVSAIEKGKIYEYLPIRTENFKTSTSITTTINIYTLETDPRQSIRIEIYGPNFNNSSLTGQDAIAFKESLQEAKSSLKKYKLNLNNLQIIYGNRQYIQDTAIYWIKEFNLLN